VFSIVFDFQINFAHNSSRIPQMITCTTGRIKTGAKEYNFRRRGATRLFNYWTTRKSSIHGAKRLWGCDTICERAEEYDFRGAKRLWGMWYRLWARFSRR